MMRRPALTLLFALLLPVAAHAATLRIDGEVYALEKSSLMPPMIDRMWNFNITRLAPDGEPVKQGDVVLAFDGNQIMQQLNEKRSQLAEKQMPELKENQ